MLINFLENPILDMCCFPYELHQSTYFKYTKVTSQSSSDISVHSSMKAAIGLLLNSYSFCVASIDFSFENFSFSFTLFSPSRARLRNPASSSGVCNFVINDLSAFSPSKLLGNLMRIHLR